MRISVKPRVLAVTSETRLSAMTDVPTVAEAGMPELTARQFIGLFAPKGTSQSIIERIAEASRATMANRDLQRMFFTAGFDSELDSNPEKARLVLQDEISKWAPVIKSI